MVKKTPVPLDKEIIELSVSITVLVRILRTKSRRTPKQATGRRSEDYQSGLLLRLGVGWTIKPQRVEPERIKPSETISEFHSPTSRKNIHNYIHNILQPITFWASDKKNHQPTSIFP